MGKRLILCVVLRVTLRKLKWGREQDYSEAFRDVIVFCDVVVVIVLQCVMYVLPLRV